ncbi:hypothetical protein D3C81_690760 [compost metagenome]
MRLQLGDQGIGNLVTDAHGHGDRHAALAARTVGSTHQRADGIVQFSIRHQHRVVLGTAQGLHALAALGAFGIDVLGDRGRADEAQRLDLRGFDQCVHRFLVAVHHVQHALGQARLVQQLGDQQGGARVALGRLEDEAVAAGDGQRVHPQRHHGREVERGDASDHADWLQIGPGIDVRADVAAVLTLEDFRCSRGELDVLDTALEFPDCVFDGLAMLFTDELGNALLVRLQQLLEAEHHLRTLCRRGIAPSRESSLGRIDGLLHGGTARQAELVNRLAGGGVEYVSGARIVCDVFTVDQVLDSGHLRSS